MAAERPAAALAPGAQQLLQRAVTVAPSTFDAERRTVEVVWSTGADVPRTDWDGSYIERLDLSPGRVRLDRLNAGAPLLNSHANASLADVVGVVERAWLAGNEGRAIVRFSDREDVAPILQDVANGILRNISVGYKVHRWENTPPSTSTGVEIRAAVDWEPYELSIVPIPADAGAQVRSENITQGDNMANAIDNNANDKERLQPTASEIRKAREVQRKLDKLLTIVPTEHHEQIRQLAERDGFAAARDAGLDLAAAEQAKCPTQARSYDASDDWAGRSAATRRDALADAVMRAMDGERLAEPLWLQLRREGVPGSNAADVFRAWLQGRRDPLIQRGMHSTSDAPALLLSAGDRLLQQQFAMAAGGVLAAAMIRPLADYRPASIIDVGKVGGAKKISEGGEIKFSTIEESAQTLKPYRWGDGLSVTPEALANDDLGGLRQAIGELGAAAMDAERTELVYLLEGTANGGTCADGQALFHANHKNAVAAGPLGIDKLGEAVALLRAQKTVGGRHIDQQPGVILCGVGAELTIRQLLSAAVVPNTPANVNPWADLSVEVDPRIGDSYAYLVSAGPRLPLQLGRLYPAPQVTDEVQFSTGAYRVKAEHAFGVAVAEFRSIVRMKLSA